MTKYVKSIKFSTSGETYVIRDAEQKSRLDTLEPQVAEKADTTTVNTALAGKQNKLTAGANITIENDVISATGGSGGGAVDSVNGKTGTVTLTASDVGAATEAQGDLADTAVQPADIADMETQTHASGTYQTKLTSANAGTNVTITEESGVVKINAAGGSGGASTFAELQGQPTDNANLAAALNAKISTGGLKTINNTSLEGSDNIELLTSSDLDNYYTKQEADSEFLTSSDVGTMATENKDDYYTKTAADAEFLTSNQGSENNGKVLGIDSTGNVIPVVNESQPSTNGFSGKILSIMGDSITTFAGWTPVADGHNLEHRNRYPQSNLFTDVKYCWWYKLFNDLGMQLGINDSWAGSRVNNIYDNNPSGDQGVDKCMASLTRITNLGSNGTPDLILYYGGTNDCGHDDGTDWVLGTFDSTANHHTVDLTSHKWASFADAFKCSIMRMQYFYPNAKIIVMLPTYCTSYYTMGKLDQYNEVVKEICDYFGVPVIDLRQCGINWQNKGWTLGDGIHPTAAGADMIYRYVKEKILSLYSMESGIKTRYTISHNLAEGISGSKFWYKTIDGNKQFTEELTSDGTIDAVITMGGVDITSSAWNAGTGTITIANVTGNVIITASADMTYYGKSFINGKAVYNDSDVFADPETLTQTINKASRGWAYSNTPVNEPINTLWFYTDAEITDGVVTMGVAENQQSTYLRSQVANYNKSGTEKELITVTFPETYYLNSSNEKLIFFGQDSTNFSTLYHSGSAQTPISAYNRVPVAYGSGTAWSSYGTGTCVGIAVGYIPDITWYKDNNLEANSSIYANSINNASSGWAYKTTDAIAENVPINAIRFYTNTANLTGVITIGAATPNSSTMRVSTTAHYKKSGTTKDLVTVVFPEAITLQTGEVLVMFAGDNDSYNFLYGNSSSGATTGQSIYNKAIKNGNTWGNYDSGTIQLGIDVGYCHDLDSNSYYILPNITNGSTTGAARIDYGETATVTIIPNTDYKLPETITVTGATYVYDSTSGIVTLSNPTSNVTIEAVCESAVSITWYTNESQTGSTGVVVAGYGWAPKISTTLINKPVNIINFKASATSGSFEIGKAIYGESTATDVQTIAWNSSNKGANNIVTIELPNTITLNTNEYFVVFPNTQPSSGSQMLYSSIGGSGFYSDTPVSRRGNNPWKPTSTDSYSLQINFGYKTQN